MSAGPDIRDLSYYETLDSTLVHGEGIYVYDAEGKRYIDCGSGTFNLSLGYGHPEIVATIREQAGKLIHSTTPFQNEPVNRLTRRLAELSPKRLTKVHLKVASGSSANEGAVKIAQHMTGKRDIITMFRGHLGQTLAMIALAGNSFRRQPFPYTFPGAVHVPDPYCYRCFYRERPETCGMLCVERIHDFIEHASSGSVAAVLIEPISGSGGNIVPPRGYLPALRQFCDAHGILLIFDELQTGIGRTGHMFAADHFGVEPDILTIGKGLGGSGAQVAGILTSQELAGLPSYHHSFTFGGNALAAAAADKTLEVISRPGFLENVREVGGYLRERLRDLQRRHRGIGDVRGVGLMIGLEIVTGDGGRDVARTNAIAERAREAGLLLRTSEYGRGNVVKIRPPLILTRQEADLICDRLEQVLIAVDAQ
jgi:4-aminobutyrate aminotransferase-like enzyme